MSMKQLISKKVCMKKFLAILIFISLSTGCSRKVINKTVDCSNRSVPPKSLQFLEYQYNCNSN